MDMHDAIDTDDLLYGFTIGEPLAAIDTDTDAIPDDTDDTTCADADTDAASYRRTGVLAAEMMRRRDAAAAARFATIMRAAATAKLTDDVRATVADLAVRGSLTMAERALAVCGVKVPAPAAADAPVTPPPPVTRKVMTDAQRTGMLAAPTATVRGITADGGEMTVTLEMHRTDAGRPAVRATLKRSYTDGREKESVMVSYTVHALWKRAIATLSVPTTVTLIRRAIDIATGESSEGANTPEYMSALSAGAPRGETFATLPDGSRVRVTDTENPFGE